MSRDSRPYLVLDAYGVMYQPGDDVEGLLIPFIAERGGHGDPAAIKARYREASVSRIGAADFWAAVGLNAGVEDEYLGRVRLVDGVPAFLAEAASAFAGIGCLSNDVSDWSRKLRERHRLTDTIRAWVVSGDVRLRKPDPEIYRRLLERLGVPGNRVLFVDDRLENLNAARDLGIGTVWMAPDGRENHTGHAMVQRLEDILRIAEGGVDGTRRFP